MSNESCASCRFASPSVSNHWEGLQCHRRQPVLQSQPRTGASWPNVNADWWCGEYEAAAVAKPAPKRAPRPVEGEAETA